MHAEMLVLRFSESVVDQPIIYRLVKDYDLEFNLLKATIYPRKEGIIVMELRGHPKNFRRGLKYLRALRWRAPPRRFWGGRTTRPSWWTKWRAS